MTEQVSATPAPPPRPRRWPWFAVLLILGFSGGGLYYFSVRPVDGHDESIKNKGGRFSRYNDNSPAVVSVETARSGDFPVFLNALGTVTALRSVTVRSRVDGELIRVAFREGQMVKEGELLAEIDPRPYRIQVRQAEGQLLRDQALLKNAELDQQRYQTLLEQDSIAAQQTVTQEALVKQYRGSVEMDQAQLANARLQLEFARISAPIAGLVGLRQVDQGNMVRAGDANGLAVITQVQPISVVFTLPEDQLPAVAQRYRSDKELSVDAYDRSGQLKLASGKLIAIDNQIDPATGTVKLRARFDNREHSLFVNQFVNVRLHLDTLRDVTQVSGAAIQHDAEGAYLYVIDAENIAHLRRIEAGPVQDDKVALPAHLAAGESVVISGHDRVKDGAAVDVAERDGRPVAGKPKPPAGQGPGKPGRPD
ncbi:MdtA/MuxA family multidrug efflux RND transporter periplasmic adaptor subunit [Methylomonas sp. SURF-2]|uniref:MdtA/MuxA family multidrug efflux RND transporter periplasmic adaptor subunit n=1 Tax=Methylomonas subterranea TaxID=2952225 RepID=A0ABT1TLJ8_9GAMM|nr:MdtA/MuxA family multidrug efflux RND transporter periplasmic adaptor subunit [Methylomonas sp. SURF-2]MCQ8106335.1 MdtA/MuxA family multidrug efflux RND transporter periplasmic adaptor subunit [Methylomonas sp. SURF-2]